MMPKQHFIAVRRIWAAGYKAKRLLLLAFSEMLS